MLIMLSVQSRETNAEPAFAVGFQNKLPMVSIYDSNQLCCQGLRSHGPVPTLSWSVPELCSTIRGLGTFLWKDVTHCIHSHYNGWQSNRSTSYYDNYFYETSPIKIDSIKCPHIIRFQLCKRMQFSFPNPVRLEEDKDISALGRNTTSYSKNNCGFIPG